MIGAPASSAIAALAGSIRSNSAAFVFADASGALALNDPAAFSGTLSGFTGNGTLAGSDQIDLHGLNFNSLHDSYDGSTGVLTVSDGRTTSYLHFLGDYSAASFKFAGDGSSGAIVYDNPTSGSAQSLQVGSSTTTTGSVTIAPGQDAFVFAPNFATTTISQFDPSKDIVAFSHTDFSSVLDVLAASHDDGHGDVVISNAAHHTVTIQHVTLAQLLGHASDFHIV